MTFLYAKIIVDDISMQKKHIKTQIGYLDMGAYKYFQLIENNHSLPCSTNEFPY